MIPANVFLETDFHSEHTFENFICTTFDEGFLEEAIDEFQSLVLFHDLIAKHEIRKIK